jgi:hypothetical protein
MKHIISSILISLTCAWSATFAAEDPPADIKPVFQNNQAIEYKGVGLKDWKVWAEHRVIASFDGNSSFTIKDYLFYAKKSESGEDCQKRYLVENREFRHNPNDLTTLNKVISKLQKGDLVLLEWKHFYHEVPTDRDLEIRPQRPLLLLKKISREEANALLAKTKKIE